MRLHSLLSSLAVSILPTAVLSQDTSRIRTRTGTSSNAVCTNTAATVTATATFAPLLSVHLGSGDECPQAAALGVHYHNENDIGCCTQSAVLTTVAPDGKLACCGCGTTCTGAVPQMMDWTFTNGQFITTPDTASPTGTGTGTSNIPATSTGATTNPQTTGQPTLTSSSPPLSASPTTSATATTTTTTTPGSASPALNVGYTTLFMGLAVGVFAVLML